MMTKAPLRKRNSPRIAPKMLEVLKIIGEESWRNGTDKFTDAQIDARIKAYRRAK